MEFIELTTNEYRDFASHHPYYNFLNSVESFETRSTSGWKHVFVGVKENNQIIAATGIMFVPVMKKFFYAYAQRGFLIDYHNEELLSFFTSNLKKYLKDKKVLYITADPYVLYQERNLDGDIVTDGFNNHYVIENMQKVGFVHQGFTTGFDPRSQVRFMMTLNLKDKDTHQILKEMDQQTRWSVNKTIKLGVKVREINLDELDVFEDVMAYTSKKKNIQNMGKSYYERQYKAFGKDNFKLIISYLDLDEFKETVAKDRIREEATLNEIEAALIETPNSKKFLKKKKFN